MAKYRKKPVVIDAWPVRELIKNAQQGWTALPESIRQAYDKGDVLFLAEAMTITTLEGIHRADIDDMVLQGVKGELYPCKPDIFIATSEEV